MVPREEVESLGGRVFTAPSYGVAGCRRVLPRLFCEEGWGNACSHTNVLSVFLCARRRSRACPCASRTAHSTAGRGEPAKNAARSILGRFPNVYLTRCMACGRYAGE